MDKMPKPIFVPDADQIAFGVLVESLEHFGRFAAMHTAVMPRYQLYQGMLHVILRKETEAATYLKQARELARSQKQWCDAAVAWRELAKLEQSRPDLEAARIELERHAAHVEAQEALEAAQKLPGGDQPRKAPNSNNGLFGRAFWSKPAHAGDPLQPEPSRFQPPSASDKAPAPRAETQPATLFSSGADDAAANASADQPTQQQPPPTRQASPVPPASQVDGGAADKSPADGKSWFGRLLGAGGDEGTRPSQALAA